MPRFLSRNIEHCNVHDCSKSATTQIYEKETDRVLMEVCDDHAYILDTLNREEKG